LSYDQQLALKTLLNYQNKKFTLLYRGSRDGLTGSAFHAKADNILNTLTIVKTTKNNIFGGFSSISWSLSGYSLDNSAFLFSLVNPQGYGAYKLPVSIGNSYAIYGNSNYGPSFGSSGPNNLHIMESGAQGRNNYASAGYPSSYGYLDGEGIFVATEIETFQIQ
jgi:hypothetical protein